MVKRFDLPKEVKEVITAPIPEEVIQEREGGGGKSLSYLSGATVTDMLNKAFGYMWSWEVKERWIEESIPFFNSNLKYVKHQEGKEIYNDKEGVWMPQGPVCHVLGTLTVPLIMDNGETIYIKKDGFGSKSILGKQNDQESIFKAADTDALKKAASRYGIGLELYRNEEEQNFFYSLNYEDPWTDEARAAHKGALETVSNMVKKYEMDGEALDNVVSQFSEGNLSSMAEITPDIVDEFAKYLIEMDKTVQEQAK